jgi:hypothetical protein
MSTATERYLLSAGLYQMKELVRRSVFDQASWPHDPGADAVEVVRPALDWV